MSPGDKFGASWVSTHISKPRWFIGPLTIHGAVTPWLRKEAMKFCVFHEPNGAQELRRLPLDDHPVCLASLVLVAFGGKSIYWI